MQINLIQLIRDNLLTFARDIRIVEFIRILTTQAEKAFNDFNNQVSDWMYKLNANASVISLTHHIKRELDVDVLITELDGKPIDFLVSVHGFADEKKISQIIDTYGLASRSYVFENGEPLYYSSFINHACELSLTDNHISFNVPANSYDLNAHSQFAVNSDIIVTIKQTAQEQDFIYVETKILKGQIIGSRTLQFWDENQIISIVPDADDIYRYTFDNAILTN